MLTDDEQSPPLGETWKDVGIAVTKGVSGSIPFVSSIISEIIGLVIPNQRLSRIEDYIRYLSKNLANIREETLKERFENSEIVDLFEEGAAQSLRALSDNRKEYIARLVSNGISGDEKARIESKRLLTLLELVDDDQIIILTSYLRRYRHDEQWSTKHKNTLATGRSYIGAPQQEHDDYIVREIARAQLLHLGLLRAYFRSIIKDEIPEFDDRTGMMKSSFRDFTLLGRLLLRRIGVADEGEL